MNESQGGGGLRATDPGASIVVRWVYRRLAERLRPLSLGLCVRFTGNSVGVQERFSESQTLFWGPIRPRLDGRRIRESKRPGQGHNSEFASSEESVGQV